MGILSFHDQIPQLRHKHLLQNHCYFFFLNAHAHSFPNSVCVCMCVCAHTCTVILLNHSLLLYPKTVKMLGSHTFHKVIMV